MTREKAIKWVKFVHDVLYENKDEEIREALNMAIEALSAEVVSREDYHNLLMASNDIDRALRQYQAKYENQSAEAEDRLYIKIYADDEPSVKAEKLYQICDETQNREVAEWLKEYFPLEDRPPGKWISQEYDDLKISDYRCSVCGTYRDDIENYCPNCGADMRGEE